MANAHGYTTKLAPLSTSYFEDLPCAKRGPEDKAMVFRLIDTIATKKKFKDFVAAMQ